MIKYKSRKLFLLVFLPIVLVLLYFTAQWRAKIAVEDFLNRKIPSNITFAYDNLKVNFIWGDLVFLNPEIQIRNNVTDSMQLTVDLKRISIEDIHYWKLLNDEEIKVDKILINEPDFIFQTNPGKKKEKSDKTIKLLKPIHVEDLVVENGSIKIIQDGEVEVLGLDSLSVNLNGGRTDVKIINEKIPFEYNTLDLQLRRFEASLGKFEAIEIAKMEISENDN